MAVTYVEAAERDVRRELTRATRFGHADLRLVMTSTVAALAIVLAYMGRVAAFELSERTRTGAPVVNLNTVANPGDLEPALAPVFPNLDDRRRVAADLFRFLASEREARRVLPNVGAIAHAHTTPTSPTLLTAAELATLKPGLVVRTHVQFRDQVLLWSVLYIVGFHAVAFVWRLRRIDGDRALLAAAHLLTAIGFAVLLSRPDPLRDMPLFVRYAEGVAWGLALMAALSLVDFGKTAFLELSYLPLFCAVVLSVSLIVFGYGPGRSHAKVNLGPVQPVEAVRLLLALFLAGYFARRWELLREVRGQGIRRLPSPAWMHVPRALYVVPVLVGVAMALAFSFLQRDLGPALLLCCVFLAVYAVARGRIGMAMGGFGVLVAGFYTGYLIGIPQTLAERVRMWQSPWDNAVAGGDQVTHAIWAMAGGGPFGTGLGLGDSRYVPAGHTDLILAAIGEELGVLGLIAIAVTYAIVVWRGLRIARSASNDYGFFLGTALTLFLIVPALVMTAGIVGVIPLTGVVTPFLSYGGSAMVSNFAALGMLSSIGADRRRTGDFSPFRAPVNWLVATLAFAALLLVVVVVNVQVVHADEYIVRPYLGTQADGGRRYAYNPRIQEIVRQIPRGTVYDRRGIPLATDDAAAIAAAVPKYEKLGVSLGDVCPPSSGRCYPLGGRAFHLLGDARTHLNWGAPNASYIERDSEDKLRGFDDHASTVQTRDASGHLAAAVHRDYRELVGVLRHRYEPTHPAVVSLRKRSRDIRLTIDAGLQLQVSSIVASYAKTFGGKAAAIVLDPDTGAVLASASYPWPALSDAPGAERTAESTENLLDRARYGLYPPGSTFKLVTASAALRQNADLGASTFTCTRLPDGRVGAKIDGWSRPIRDDVMDTHPHGTIDMRAGLVHSCNAYFAQLAMKLGPGPLVDAAARLGISLTPAASAVQRVRDTLPQVGYGQGDVVATPLRMARVVAAIASGGVLHDAFWQENAPAASRSDVFLKPATARILGSYLREAVTSGTGRSLRNHPWRIAGKTGTAELSGDRSHAWFVGFAPYGPATRRIAFAVIMENAGYGGAAAAPAAGEIVTAAAVAGMIK